MYQISTIGQLFEDGRMSGDSGQQVRTLPQRVNSGMQMSLLLFRFKENWILWLVIDEIGFPAKSINLADCDVIFWSDDLIDGVNCVCI